MSDQANRRINWGILTTGAIAKAFARGLPMSKSGTAYAVASREQAKAEKFGDEFKVPKRYGSYEAMLADSNVQAVYIATPHPMHARWAIAAIEAGKHVLVEKPFGVNHAEAMAIFEAAVERDVLTMEAFMYRCHPQTAKLVELIRSRAIGDVRVIQATFSFHAGFNAESRAFANHYAGGGIMDVGCYPVSMSRLIAGAATGKDFANPTDVKGQAHLGQTGVDEWAIASLKFPGNILAQLATGVSVNQENVVRVFGSEGSVLIDNPWMANRNASEAGRIIVKRNDEKEPQIVGIDAPYGTSFALEADAFGRALAEGKRQAVSPAMSWDDTLGNMRTLDRWRDAVGLTFEFEKPESFARTTIAGCALSPRAKHNMKYGRIAGLDRPMSRLVMGCDNQRSFTHAAAMFDHYFECGGNAFDTAYVYGGGTMERLVGQWLKLRGVRDQVVLIAKGAHTPWCDPASLTRQLTESLDRLGVDGADIYMMHRDNPQVPIGEFVEVLNEHRAAGRFKVFGGSNWSLTRVDEANAYAKKHGKQGFAVVSNNFSLARMVNPVWGGCIAASDPESRAWFERTQTALLSWSSQARGFFLPGRAAPDKLDDREMVNTWYSDDNFQRLERANELARKKGVNPINIALAYVLCQPFPTFALIGPRLLSETRTSLAGLDVELTAGEVKWLNLEG